MAGPDRLYLEDAYLQACDATVVALHEGCVALDRTVFYGHRHDYGHPQASDKGLVRSGGRTLRVKRVDDEGDALYHYIEGRPLPARGAAVRCEVDFPRRLVVMRLHTAAHVLLAGSEELGLRVKPIASRSPEIDALSVCLYFEPGGLSRDRAEDLEEAANRALEQPREVVVRWRSREEVEAQPSADRLRLARIPWWHDPLRLIEIAGLCEYPCDGTLVRNTREVGRVEVREVRRMKIGTKLVVGLKGLAAPSMARSAR